MSIIYLHKAGDDVISHCKCSDGRITFPGQADCPWCGCGWLFSCVSCRKAFTFAEAVELDTTLEALMREDYRAFWHKEPSDETIRERVEVMQILLKSVEVGKRYVYLDGFYLLADAKNVHFNGWHAHHSLDVLPQFAALDDKEILKKTLLSFDYWKYNEIPEDED
jgi:hypothetical protein